MDEESQLHDFKTSEKLIGPGIVFQMSSILLFVCVFFGQ